MMTDYVFELVEGEVASGFHVAGPFTPTIADQAVATVSINNDSPQNYEITALSEGETTITMTLQDGTREDVYGIRVNAAH